MNIRNAMECFLNSRERLRIGRNKPQKFRELKNYGGCYIKRVRMRSGQQDFPNVNPCVTLTLTKSDLRADRKAYFDSLIMVTSALSSSFVPFTTWRFS